MNEKERELFNKINADLKSLGFAVIEFDVNQKRFDSEYGPRLLVTLQAVRKLTED